MKQFWVVSFLKSLFLFYVFNFLALRYEKGTLPLPPYLGFDDAKLHLLPQHRTKNQIRIAADSKSAGTLEGEEVGGVDVRKELMDHATHMGSVIVYSPTASDELYHFLVPLRAYYLHASLLKPIVIMLAKE